MKHHLKNFSHTLAPICRRGFLKLGAALAVTSMGSSLANAKTMQTSGERSLLLHNLHTGEILNTVYWAEGQYIPDALNEINHILRDHRTDESSQIDPLLVNLLHQIHTELDAKQPFQIISGYRSPTSNATLVATTAGVAKHSLHMDGKAIDIRLPGYDLRQLHQVAVAMRAGGVGYYPASDFVHIDVGRVRTW